MRSAKYMLLWTLFIPALAAAQGDDNRRGWIYGLVGPAVFSNAGSAMFSAAGGGEFLLTGGLALGGEAGYLAPDGIGLASADVSYHFGGRYRQQRLVPFVIGGGSLGFRSGISSGGGNVGGGIQYWMSSRTALRIEVRDFIFSSDSPHLLTFRIGIAFR